MQVDMSKMFISRLYASALTEPEPDIILEHYAAIKRLIKATNNFLTQEDINNLT